MNRFHIEKLSYKNFLAGDNESVENEGKLKLLLAGDNLNYKKETT
jgi:hypothetical protein